MTDQLKNFDREQLTQIAIIRGLSFLVFLASRSVEGAALALIGLSQGANVLTALQEHFEEGKSK